MNDSRADVAPEIMSVVVAGALMATDWSQLKQLTTWYNDRRNPIGIRRAPVGYFDQHALDEPTLKAALHLGEQQIIKSHKQRYKTPI
jgi:hypothetical protein